MGASNLGVKIIGNHILLEPSPSQYVSAMFMILFDIRSTY